MAVNTQFSIAVHILSCLAYRAGLETKSAQLATSINTSASFVRRTLAKLSKAGLVETTKGKAGACRLARKPGQITLLDIYEAADAPKAFAIHNYPPKKGCTVSCSIKRALEKALESSQEAMESRLKETTLADILTDIDEFSPSSKHRNQHSL